MIMRVSVGRLALGTFILSHGCAAPAETPKVTEQVTVEGRVVLWLGLALDPIEGTDYALLITGMEEEAAKIVSPTAKTVLEFGEAPTAEMRGAARLLEVQRDLIEEIERSKQGFLTRDAKTDLRKIRAELQRLAELKFVAFDEIAARVRQDDLDERIRKGDLKEALAESRTVLAELKRRIPPGLVFIGETLAELEEDADEIVSNLERWHEDQASGRTLDAAVLSVPARQVDELLQDFRELHPACLPESGRQALDGARTMLQEFIDVPATETLLELMHGLDEALELALADARKGTATAKSLTALRERAKQLTNGFEALLSPSETDLDDAGRAEFDLGAQRLHGFRERVQVLLAAPNSGHLSGPIEQALRSFADEADKGADALKRRRTQSAQTHVERALKELSRVESAMGELTIEPVANHDRSTIWIKHGYQDEWKVSRIMIADGTVMSCGLAKGQSVRPTRSPTRAWLVGDDSVRVLDAASASCEQSVPRARRPESTLLHDGDILVELPSGLTAFEAPGESQASEPGRCPDESAEVDLTARIFHIDGRTIDFELPKPGDPTSPPDFVLVADRSDDRLWIADKARVHRVDYRASDATVQTIETGATKHMKADPWGEGVFVVTPGPQIVHLPSESPVPSIGTAVEECDELMIWESGHAACKLSTPVKSQERLLVKPPGGPTWRADLRGASAMQMLAVDHLGAPYLTVFSSSNSLGEVHTFALSELAETLSPLQELLLVRGVSQNGRYALVQQGVRQFAITDLFSGAPARIFSLSRSFKQFDPFVHDRGNAVWANIVDYDSDDYTEMELDENSSYEEFSHGLLVVEADGLEVEAKVEMFGEPVDLGKKIGQPITIPADEDSLLLTFNSADFLPEMGSEQIKKIADHELHLEILGAQDQLLLRTCEGCQLAMQRVPMMAPNGGTDIAALEDGPVTLQLHYTDGRGSLIEIRHTGVVFQRKFSLAEYLTRHPSGRAWSVYLAVMLLTALCVGALRQRPRVLAFSPPALAATALTGVLGTSWSSASINQIVSLPLFTGLLGGTAAVAAMLGLLSTSFLRRLVLIEPYRFVAPYLLLAPHVRRRWYAEFVVTLRKKVLAESRFDDDAAEENYVPLPAEVTVYEHGEDGVVRRRVEGTSSPHDYVREVLTARGPMVRAQVVIVEAPGGRGKSCLKRQIVTRMCIDARTAADRIPVACDVSTGGPAADLKAGLGTLGDCEPLFESELQHGRYVLVYDDAVTRGLDAKRVAEFCERNPEVGLLIVTRSFPALVQELESVANVYRVVPKLLERGNLRKFIEAYAREAEVEPFSERALMLRSAGDTYLPVLVRLGLLAYQRDPTTALTISSIYDDILRRLLSKQYRANEVEGAIAGLIDLCNREYWIAGKPYLDFQRAQEADKPLLKACHDSGLLVDLDGSRVARDPERVRFFHDSLRGYLVARWAVREYEAHGGQWEEMVAFLETTASSSKFRESEIFTMTLSMVALGREDDLQRALSDRIEAWSDELAEALSPMSIKSSAPTDMDLDVKEMNPSQAIAGVLERIRLARSTAPERLQRTSYFFRQMAVHVAAAREAKQ